MSKREFTCIVCPRGCHIEVDDDLNVTGNSCPRGKDYVLSEITNPVRVVTSTVRVKNRPMCVVSVKTNTAIPKSKIFELMDVINQASVDAPTHVGDVVVDKPLGLDTQIVITKEIK
ncbi:MAG: DUF1667 domain-containing protein [Erysipelotrichaceae bacterium]|nr:DUF1667 domain-containing protein [Erysipelotrichaceae bacterium]